MLASGVDRSAKLTMMPNESKATVDKQSAGDVPSGDRGLANDATSNISGKDTGSNIGNRAAGTQVSHR